MVTSSVADEVHLHGYDKVDVRANGTATLTFTATIPASWKNSAKALVILEVS